MSLEQLLNNITARREQVEAQLADPVITSDFKKSTELAREYRRLKDVETLNARIVKTRREVDEMNEALDDPELAQLAGDELPALEEKLQQMESKLRGILLPPNPEDLRNAVLEIRAGTGGEEAALFAGDLYKMYINYIERTGWKHHLISGTFSDLGGVKEALVNVVGEGAYGQLKLESGVHRVQRVPVTEASGRVHTSAATVAVLPEAEEVDVELDLNDLEIDTYRASGPGGQHVNKTDSAIRITHIPTGIVVTCQDEKSQLKNKHQALKVLRSRLYQIALEEEQEKRSAQRRSQVSTGDRSAKIRTYNFSQGRVTDHRVPVTVFRLEEILQGDLDLILGPVSDFFVERLLAEAVKYQ